MFSRTCMCSCSGHLREKPLVALESKQCNTVTEPELNMDWVETGLAQAPKASTSTPGRRP